MQHEKHIANFLCSIPYFWPGGILFRIDHDTVFMGRTVVQRIFDEFDKLAVAIVTLLHKNEISKQRRCNVSRSVYCHVFSATERQRDPSNATAISNCLDIA